MPDRYLQPYNVRLWGYLVIAHIAVIAASNYLVQIPMEVFGFHSTWGALSFPVIYFLSDITVRVQGYQLARWVVLIAMLPALIISYLIGSLFEHGEFQNLDALVNFNSFVFRIALASFAAYVVGQLMDIGVFHRLRRAKSWWVAPTGSSIMGNGVDSLVFFSVAFYASSDPYMAENWVEIGLVDFVIKMAFSLLAFVPLYGVLVQLISTRYGDRN